MFARVNSGPPGAPKRKHRLTVVAATDKLASDLTSQAVTPRQPRSGRSSASSSAGSLEITTLCWTRTSLKAGYVTIICFHC